MAEQIALIERMTTSGQDAVKAKMLFQNVEQTLEICHAQRWLILKAMRPRPNRANQPSHTASISSARQQKQVDSVSAPEPVRR
jgi:hypothetical protein